MQTIEQLHRAYILADHESESTAAAYGLDAADTADGKAEKALTRLLKAKPATLQEALVQAETVLELEHRYPGMVMERDDKAVLNVLRRVVRLARQN